MGNVKEELLSISVWLTPLCNLKCDYCYEGSEKKGSSISSNNMNLVVSFIECLIVEKNFKFVNITFHGGEPLLCYEKIKWIVTYFKSKSKICDVYFYYALTTNATLLDDEKRNYLIKNILDLSISIDGMKQSHDMHRIYTDGKGSFDVVLKNVYSILKERNDIRLRMTVCADTVEFLFDNVMFLIGIGGKVIVPSIDYYDTRWNESRLKELHKQLIQLADYLYVNNLMNEVKVAMINYTFDDVTFKTMCDGGVSSFSIYCNGDIYPCLEVVGHPEYRIGDLQQGLVKEKVRRLKEIGSYDNMDCIGCSNLRFCENNRCKIINHLFTGDYYKVHPLKCVIENIQYSITKYNVEKYYS